MRILSTELSQLKRIAIIYAIKIDKKMVPFFVLSLQKPIDKNGTFFHLLQTNLIAR